MQSFNSENKILTIDISANKSNYSQRNNEYTHKYGKILEVSGNTMCNVTAMCQSLDYNGFMFPPGNYTQPEDNLAAFIMNDPRVDEYYKTCAPILYRDYKSKKLTSKGERNYYTPNEVHCVLAHATNLWLRTTAVTFKENCLITDIVQELIEGRSCVISGIFNGLGHIVSLVGAEWKLGDVASHISISTMLKSIVSNGALPNTFIIDDPYGKWNAPEGYKSKVSGNNSTLSQQEFMQMIKPINNYRIKMCHLIKSGASTII